MRVEVHHHDTADVASGFGSFASRTTVVAGNAVAVACRPVLARAREEGIALAEAGEVSGRFDKPHPSFSFGATLSLVSLDPETGRVVPERHVVLHDVGRAINPALVEGQLAGGAVQGVAGALLEELPYDETGQPLALSLADYRLPTVVEAPPVEVVLVEGPVPGNPLGVKGAGQKASSAHPPRSRTRSRTRCRPARTSRSRSPLTPQRVHALARPARPS